MRIPGRHPALRVLGLALLAVLVAACQRGSAGAPESATAGGIARNAGEAVATGAQPAQATPPGYAGRIAFAGVDGAVRSVLPDGEGSVIVAKPDLATQAGGFQGAYTWPVWSPDGSALLLSRLTSAGGGRLRASLVKAGAGGGQEPTLIYRDDPGSFGIGTGVPHYAVWSPDGLRVALVAGGGAGLMTLFVDPSAELAPDAFVGGEPMFLAWASNSRSLLVHHGEVLRLVEFDESGKRTGGSVDLGERSFEYLAPQFEPAGDHFVFALEGDGQSVIKIGRLGTGESVTVAESMGQTALRWSPDGRNIAFLDGEEQRVFKRLAIVDITTGVERTLASRPMHSFWWSPDGTRIAVASLAEGRLDAIVWSVVDIASGNETALGVNVPTAEFQFMQTFFDQYAHSHALWSPDGRAIVVFGAMLDDGRAGEANGIEGGPDSMETGAQVWILDASGQRPPKSVGQGYIGAWSPR